MKSTTARGREFEAEIAGFFRRAGFEVILNPKVSKPRQTDLFVRDDDGTDFLIEAKNQKRKIDVNDIDAIRSRLGRAATTIIGVIFTTSGITSGAVEAIQTDRRREILVFVAEELEALRSHGQNIRALIERKRAAIRVQGQVWIGPLIYSAFSEVLLPSSAIELRVGGISSSYFESKSGLAGALYALALPDPGWGSIAGEGARLTIDLALNSVRELRDIFGYLHGKFGLSRNGIFSIQQSECCWCGFGAEDLIVTLNGWRKRYAQSSTSNFHHSEEFRYFDEFRDGWVELSAQQRIDFDSKDAGDSMLYHSELVIQLPGIPVDSLPFLKLCRYVGSQWSSFQYFGNRITFRKRLKKNLRLQVIGVAVNKRDFTGGESSVVTGVVARNPFYRKKSLPVELDELDIPMPELTEMDLILCSLKDWHDDGDAVDRYELYGFEVTLGGAGSVIRPFGTWNKMLKRAR